MRSYRNAGICSALRRPLHVDGSVACPGLIPALARRSAPGRDRALSATPRRARVRSYGMRS
ncbi:hypothetical protein XFF6991_390067 [Xanthomonas phaseoli pv. phaseoli]|uniref:Uncharacterized protein n=1 Tax=Xanthomonas campestris pv. phaseoli TaxID=317013 RepID=A0A7Z7NIG2_XANCH|nr:hypothetical protein XFF6991_390067 [Xanthomonas phaseoli pv. phaseoli]